MRALRTLVIAVCCAACAVGAAARDVLIGQTLDLSGVSSLGKDFSSGLLTYFDAVNARGGVKGRKLRLIQLDNAGRAADALAQTDKLFGEQDLDLLIGPTSDGTLRAIINAARLKGASLAIVGAPTGSLAEPSSGGPSVFSLRANYRDEARLLFDALNTFAGNRVALVVGDGPDALSTALSARAEARARGITLAFDGDANQWLKYSGKRQLGAVILPGDAVGIAPGLQAARRDTPHIPVFGFSTVDHRTLQELAGTAARGVMLAQVMPPPGKTMYPFQREHRTLMKQYRDEPPSQDTLEGYVVVRVVVAALERIEGEPNSGKVLAALRGLPTQEFGPLRVCLQMNNDEQRPRFVDLSAISSRGGLIE